MTPKKQAAAKAFKAERKRWAKVKQKTPARDPKYLKFIREQHCMVCELRTGSEAGTPGRIEAAHTGTRGLRQKASDYDAVPLCARHHRTGKDSHHVLGKRFWSHWELDREDVVFDLRARYELTL